jgi:hypothetical protein
MSSLNKMLANIAVELAEKELSDPNWTGHDAFQEKVRQRIEAHIANDCLYGDEGSSDDDDLEGKVVAMNWSQKRGDWK